MTNLTKRWSIVGSLVIGLCVASLAVAQPGFGRGQGQGAGFQRGEGPGQGHGFGMHRGAGQGFGQIWKNSELAEKIGLTDEQKDQLETLHFNADKERVKQDAKIKLLSMDIERETQSDEPNIDVITQKVKELHSIKADLEISRITLPIGTKKILTSEQVEQLKELREEKRKEMRENFKERFKERGERGQREMMGRGMGRYGRQQGQGGFGPGAGGMQQNCPYGGPGLGQGQGMRQGMRQGMGQGRMRGWRGNTDNPRPWWNSEPEDVQTQEPAPPENAE